LDRNPPGSDLLARFATPRLAGAVVVEDIPPALVHREVLFNQERFGDVGPQGFGEGLCLITGSLHRFLPRFVLIPDAFRVIVGDATDTDAGDLGKRDPERLIAVE